VASRFGMAEASPMNLRVCRSLGKIEFKRFLKATGSSQPDGMGAFRELFEQAWKVVEGVPEKCPVCGAAKEKFFEVE